MCTATWVRFVIRYFDKSGCAFTSQLTFYSMYITRTVVVVVLRRTVAGDNNSNSSSQNYSNLIIIIFIDLNCVDFNTDFQIRIT